MAARADQKLNTDVLKKDEVGVAAETFERLTRAVQSAQFKLAAAKESAQAMQLSVERYQEACDQAMRERAEFLSHQMNAGAPGANPEGHVES